MSFLKRYKPTTPGRRGASVLDNSVLTNKRPEKKLRTIIKKHGGRNNQGKITVRHRGGGAKRYYRIIDFKRDKHNLEAEVIALEYDPNRNANIILVQYPDKEKRYLLAPEGLRVGDKVISSQDQKIKITAGNAMPLKSIPAGQLVHNIELNPGWGGKLVRGAGTGAVIQSKDEGMVQVKMPSSEIRLFDENCLATIGKVGNQAARNVRLGKAGRRRHLGFRPSVRGKAMNPVDHPHGGGEGGNPIGSKKGPRNVYGKKALGVKTRKPKKTSSRLIIKRRSKKR